MSKVIKESPLHYVKNSNPINAKNLHVTEVAFLGYLNLRGDIKNNNFKNKIEKILDLEIPDNPNSFNQNKKFRIYGISPDEWLITTPENEEIKTEEKIRQELGEGLFFAITNVTGGFTKININGDDSRTLLKKGSSLDIDNFRPGQCASTQFSKTALLIAKTEEKNEFDLIVRRSFAEYLWLYLASNI